MCEFSSQGFGVSAQRKKIQSDKTIRQMTNEYDMTVHGSVGVGVIKGFFAASFFGYENDLFIEAIDNGNAAIFTEVVKFGDQSFESSFEYRGCSVDELCGVVLPAQVALIREQMRAASAAALRGADGEVAAEDQAAMAGAIGGVREIG